MSTLYVDIQNALKTSESHVEGQISEGWRRDRHFRTMLKCWLNSECVPAGVLSSLSQEGGKTASHIKESFSFFLKCWRRDIPSKTRPQKASSSLCVRLSHTSRASPVSCIFSRPPCSSLEFQLLIERRLGRERTPRNVTFYISEISAEIVLRATDGAFCFVFFFIHWPLNVLLICCFSCCTSGHVTLALFYIFLIVSKSHGKNPKQQRVPILQYLVF